MSGVGQAVFMNQRSFGPPPGQQAYVVYGPYSWVAPAGVTKVSVVAVGAEGYNVCSGAGGGGLGYKNNYSVTPGCTYSLRVGNANGLDSYFVSTAVVKGGTGASSVGGTYTGDGGGNGAAGTGCPQYRGGGAGGYAGDGNSGTGGAGANGTCKSVSGARNAGSGGGGVGILGQGTSGTANTGQGGSGGSAGGAGSFPTIGICICCVIYCFPGMRGGNGGSYGGGGGGSAGCAIRQCSTPSHGALRIIWPGCARSFPSTRTANE